MGMNIQAESQSTWKFRLFDQRTLAFQSVYLRQRPLTINLRSCRVRCLVLCQIPTLIRPPFTNAPETSISLHMKRFYKSISTNWTAHRKHEYFVNNSCLMQKFYLPFRGIHHEIRSVLGRDLQSIILTL
jgi:hypothetical protein